MLPFNWSTDSPLSSGKWAGITAKHRVVSALLQAPPEWEHSPLWRESFPNAPNTNNLQRAPRNQHPLPHTHCSGSGHTPCVPRAWDSSGASCCSQDCPMAAAGLLLGIAFEGGWFHSDQIAYLCWPWWASLTNSHVSNEPGKSLNCASECKAALNNLPSCRVTENTYTCNFIARTDTTVTLLMAFLVMDVFHCFKPRSSPCNLPSSIMPHLVPF